MTQSYDLIGDIHGHADRLLRLLKQLGYSRRGGCHRHPTRKVIFVGDFIDRGPKIPEVLQTVRAMVDGGEALAVMGNHEYNALCYHTRDSLGRPLRAHSRNNTRQHAATLSAFKHQPALLREYLRWFHALPLFLDLGPLRVVHACWDNERIRARGGDSRLTPELLRASRRKDSQEFWFVDTLLKGREMPLPRGLVFSDKEGTSRPEIRIRWWMNARGKTYRQMVFPDSDQAPKLKIPAKAAAEIQPYPRNAPPVFFGHYWLPPEAAPKPVAPNIACVDYSVALGGWLVAYRWDGEKRIDPRKYVIDRNTPRQA